jgi:hypothetical protein
MRTLVFLLLILPALSRAELIQIRNGDPASAVFTLLPKIAIDITSGQEFVGPKGEWPLTGVYWAARDYKLVIAIGRDESKVTEISYWNEDDFTASKVRRADSRRYAKSIVFDTEKKTYVVKNRSWWRFGK